MLKLILTVLICTSLSKAYAGIEVRNGGGGVNVNGHYMTFGTAQVPIQTKELSTPEIASLEIVIRVIQTSLLNATTKAQLTTRILPSIARRYYRADLSRLDDETKNKITDQYNKSMHVSPENFALFAITDTNSKSTALFPQFFELTPTEQAAILLHEALWTFSYVDSYERVVQTEIAFQSYTETKDPTKEQIWNLYSSLLTTLNDMQQLTGIAYLLSTNDLSKLPISAILGTEGYVCLITIMNGEKSRWDYCSPHIINNLALLRVSGQYNYFLEALFNYMVQPWAALILEVEQIPGVTPYEVSLNNPLYISGPLAFSQQKTTLPLRDSRGQKLATIRLR